jgi:hypothetical protein
MKKKLEQWKRRRWRWKRRKEKNKEEKKKERTKEEKNKEEEGKKKRRIFLKSLGKVGQWKKEEKSNPPQCLVWFRLNGLGSSKNSQNSLIHNWCIGGCWFSLAYEIMVWIMFLLVTRTGTCD